MHEAAHLPISNAEVKNEWSYTSFPLYTRMARTRKTLPFQSNVIDTWYLLSQEWIPYELGNKAIKTGFRESVERLG
jgi:hypothetical protein